MPRTATPAPCCGSSSTRTCWPPSASRAARTPDRSAPRALHRLPPCQVVPGVDQRVVGAARPGRQRRLPEVVPALAQLAGEPRDRPRQRRHRPPQLAERDVVVGGEPGPQLDLLAGAGEERQQVIADALPAAPGPVRRRRQLVEHVAPHPRDRPALVELGANRVELAAGLVHGADGDEVDGGAVLDELGVVEEAPHLLTVWPGTAPSRRGASEGTPG